MAKTLCGILIGSDEMRAIALKPVRGGYRLAGAAMHALSFEEREKPGAVLKAMLKKVKAATDRATLCVPKEQATLHCITLPAAGPDELESMVRFEAERHIPFNAERHSVGFQMLRDQGVAGTEVLVAAVDGPVIDRLLEAAGQAGVQPAGINVSSACLVNALAFCQPALVQQQVVALVSIGLQSIDLVFSVEGRIIFSRSVPHGLRGLIHDWNPAGTGANVQLDPARMAAAARMIDAMDLDRQYGDPVTATEGAKPGDAARQWLKKLIQEVTRSHDFARRQMACPPIQSVVLAGEGAAVRNLDRYFQVNLNLPVMVLNPLASLKGRTPKGLPYGGLELAVPFGAAVQDVAAGGYRLDLTPAQHYQKIERRRLIHNAIAAAVLALITFGLGSAAYSRLQSIRDEELAAYSEANDRLRAPSLELRERKRRVAILEPFFDDPTGALSVLDIISGYIGDPDRISISAVNFRRGDLVSIQGHALNTVDIAEFRDALNESDLFESAETREENRRTGVFNRHRGVSVYTFRIECFIPEYRPSERRSRERETEPAEPTPAVDPLAVGPVQTETGFRGPGNVETRIR